MNQTLGPRNEPLSCSLFFLFSCSLCPMCRSEWSPCTASCGNGIKARTRLYINPDAQGMCDIDLIQKASCFGDRPECNPSFYNMSSGASLGGTSAWNPSETKGEHMSRHPETQKDIHMHACMQVVCAVTLFFGLIPGDCLTGRGKRVSGLILIREEFSGRVSNGGKT